ncbi:hypothetical protein SynROS8604_02212 [Synechococcus sp. ROS8604]|nr:hypothetical protein SynROS8604_02212 [Synechococcus sp. ROS8604]
MQIVSFDENSCNLNVGDCLNEVIGLPFGCGCRHCQDLLFEISNFSLLVFILCKHAFPE